MSGLISAWTDKGKVHLVQRIDDQIRVRTTPAKWAFFATGLDKSDRQSLARDPRVTAVIIEGEYTRIECQDRGARYAIVEALEEAARIQQDDSIRVLEADVSPLRRLMSDNPNLEVEPSPRLLYLDLEVDSRKTFNEMREGKARLLSWAAEDSEGKQWSGCLQSDDDSSERTIWNELFVLLNSFDCIIAWSGTWSGGTFDFDVIQNRSFNLGIKHRGRDIPWHRWTWLDQLEVFQKYNFSSDDGGEAKTSYKLDHVANYLLGQGKSDFDSSRTWEAWHAGGEQRRQLLSYNVQDTHLLRMIEEKTGFLSLHLAVCHICRVFPDTDSLHATVQGDGFMLRLGSEYGYRFPSKPKWRKDQEHQKFAGAYVMPPKRLGVVDNVHVCDFAGLYPSIMRTWNMSPDTKIDSPVDPEGAFKVVKLPGRSTYFRNDKDGMFRIALDRLVAKRGEYTAEMKKHSAGTEPHAHFKRLSGAFKIVANSFYGICGSPFSRFFDPEIAEGVTQTGKWLLEYVIEQAEKAGYDPFYGDTDSAFIAGVIEAEFKKFVQLMNDGWDALLAPLGIESHHIDLDFEKTFKRLIMVSAKRYAASYAMYKGKPATGDAKEVKGLEFKRGDSIRMARDFQLEIVDLLLADGPLADASKSREVIERWRELTLHGKLKLDDVKLSQGLTKPLNEYVQSYNKDGSLSKQPAHVRVAKMLMDRGEPLGEGSKVNYIMVKGDDEAHPIPADDATIAEVDRVYYWDKRIYPPTMRVLECVYPQAAWKESTSAKKMRQREASGQIRMDLDPGKPRKRKRKRRARPVATVYMDTDPPDQADPERAQLRLEALKAAIEAHPGDMPIRLVFRWPGTEVETTELEGVGIDTSKNAIYAINRAIQPGNLAIPSDNPGQG